MARLFRVFLLLLACTCSTALAAEDGPAKDVAELQVLSQYVGTWEVKITTKGSPLKSGEATAKWILDGRFVQQAGSLKKTDGTTALKITTLMTYDPTKKAFRSWSFMSDGAMSESEAAWDANTRTMTTIYRGPDITTTTTADFSKDGIEKWSIVVVDKDKKVVNETSGINTRKRK